MAARVTLIATQFGFYRAYATAIKSSKEELTSGLTAPKKTKFDRFLNQLIGVSANEELEKLLAEADCV